MISHCNSIPIQTKIVPAELYEIFEPLCEEINFRFIFTFSCNSVPESFCLQFLHPCSYLFICLCFFHSYLFIQFTLSLFTIILSCFIASYFNPYYSCAIAGAVRHIAFDSLAFWFSVHCRVNSLPLQTTYSCPVAVMFYSSNIIS